MTYVEGASLHQERGGSAVFARYAFNELVSFVAGWAIVLDYTILVAVTALTVPSYLAAFWAPLGALRLEIAVAFAVIAFVAADNLTGVSARRLRRRVLVTAFDLAVQAAVIVLGLVLVFHPGTPDRRDPPRHCADAVEPRVRAADRGDRVHRPRGRGEPRRRGQRDAAGSAPAGRPGRRGDRADLRRHRARRRRRAAGPPRRSRRSASSTSRRRCSASSRPIHPHWLAEVAQVHGRGRRRARAAGGRRARRCSGSRGSATSLATNRQIPSAVGRLHQRYGTPYVVIGDHRGRRRRARAARPTSSCWSGSTPSARCSRSRSRTCR